MGFPFCGHAPALVAEREGRSHGGWKKVGMVAGGRLWCKPMERGKGGEGSGVGEGGDAEVLVAEERGEVAGDGGGDDGVAAFEFGGDACGGGVVDGVEGIEGGGGVRREA
jgi:hypothetical protein